MFLSFYANAIMALQFCKLFPESAFFLGEGGSIKIPQKPCQAGYLKVTFFEYSNILPSTCAALGKGISN